MAAVLGAPATLTRHFRATLSLGRGINRGRLAPTISGFRRTASCLLGIIGVSYLKGCPMKLTLVMPTGLRVGYDEFFSTSRWAWRRWPRTPGRTRRCPLSICAAAART